MHSYFLGPNPKLWLTPPLRQGFLPRSALSSLGEALGGVLNHRSDLVDLDAVALESVLQLDVSHELAQVVPLEVGFKFVEERLDVGEVQQVLLLPKLQLEEVANERVGVCVRVVHVRLDGLCEVVEGDVLGRVKCALQKVALASK